MLVGVVHHPCHHVHLLHPGGGGHAHAVLQEGHLAAYLVEEYAHSEGKLQANILVLGAKDAVHDGQLHPAGHP